MSKPGEIKVPQDKYENIRPPSDVTELNPRQSVQNFANFDKTRTVARYEFDYYTGGAQVQVFFSDIWIDDINFIEFNVEHPHIPIYGYASRLYNTTTPGRKLITGSFRINFKEAFYLHLAFAALKQRSDIAGMREKLTQQQKNASQARATGIYAGWMEESGQYNSENRQAIKAAIDSKILASNTIEDVMAGLNQKEINPSFNGETGVADTLGVTQPARFDDYNRNFDAVAEGLEDSVWGAQGESTNAPEVDSYGPFDIYLVYGDYNNQIANHTVRRLFDVELVGTTQQISVDGMPVQESYLFLARDFR